MNEKLLGLMPTRYLCPYCGKWHEWERRYQLGFYTARGCSAIHECAETPSGLAPGCYSVYFKDDYCYFHTDSVCNIGYLYIDDRIKVDAIEECEDKPIVTFKVPFRPRNKVGSEECKACKTKHICNLVNLADSSNHDDMEITLGFEFDEPAYKKIVTAYQYNNISNMNIEFGPNTDKNIASTFMGIAVKNGESWRIYDKKKKEITDIGNIQFAELPIFILPTTKLNEGDLIKDAGEYYFVSKGSTNGTVKMLCAKTGEFKNVMPVKNILGFSCYSKVVDFSDSIDMGSDFDLGKMAIMSAMCGKNGGAMDQLVPFMFLKDKLDTDDDITKLMIATSMMGASQKGTNQNDTMNQLVPLMLLNDKLDTDDDITKLMIATSMMGGNGTGDSNDFLKYLMVDMFIGKKEQKKSQQSNQKSTK